MKSITVTTITRSFQGKRLKIPGGWQAFVPEVTFANPRDREIYIRYFMADGSTPFEAERQAEEMIQDAQASYWNSQIRESVGRYAKIYAKRWPELWQEDGTLLGFKPEEMQRAFMPGENTGRRGKPFVNEMLREMREEAEG